MKTKSKIIAFMLAVTLIFSGSFVPANTPVWQSFWFPITVLSFHIVEIDK